jgi:O-antigen/teichoic acid export membrane protein
MPEIRKAVIYSSLSQYIMRSLGLFSVIFIARFLTPSELGVYALASSIMLLASELRLLGAANFIVREKELNNDKVQSALGLTMIISWGIGVALIFSAPWVATFYEYPILRDIIWIILISFFLAPHISIVTSIHSRMLNYKAIFMIRFPAQIIGMFVTVAMVLYDFGIYALAWGSTVTVIVELCTAFVIREKGYSMVPKLKGIATIFRFGIYNSMSTLLYRFTTTAPDLIIGKLGSSTDVAMYSRGLGFIDFLSNLLIMGGKPVSLPYLSQVRRDGGNMSEAYIKSTLMLCTVCWPALAFASVTSLPIIQLLFGDQWSAAAPLVSILAFWGIIRTTHTLSHSLLISVDRENVMFGKELINFLIVVISIYYAYPYGLDAIAIAMTVCALIDMLINSIVLKLSVKLKLGSMLIAFLPVIFLTVICWSASYLLSEMLLLTELSSLVKLIINSVVIFLVWILVIRMFKLQLYNELCVIFHLDGGRWKN